MQIIIETEELCLENIEGSKEDTRILFPRDVIVLKHTHTHTHTQTNKHTTTKNGDLLTEAMTDHAPDDTSRIMHTNRHGWYLYYAK